MFRDPDLERSAPVTAFLARVTHGWVAYGSEGVMLEHRLDAIAALMPQCSRSRRTVTHERSRSEPTKRLADWTASITCTR